MQWNANEKAWAKKHGVTLGNKTAGGLAANADYKRITSGGGKPPPKPQYGMQPKPPAGGGLQWNANELAWAQKHGVNLGQKTAGGLSANADYRRITGMGGGGGSALTGGGMGGGMKGPHGVQWSAYSPTASPAGRSGGGLASMLGGAGGYYAAGGTAAMKAGGAAIASGLAGTGGLGAGLALAAGPIGWGIAGAALASRLFSKKKKDYHEYGTYHGDIQKGYTQVRKDYRPTDWNAYVNDPRNKDLRDTAKSYREGTASQSDIAYWQRRANRIGAGDVTKMSNAEFARLHYEYDAQGEGARAADYRVKVPEAPKPPKPRKASAPTTQAIPDIPPPDPGPTPEEISPPGKGLEDTIKVSDPRTPLEVTDKLYATKEQGWRKKKNYAAERRSWLNQMKKVKDDEEEED